LGPAILLSDAISIEDFLSPQISIASNSNKYLLFLCLCVNTTFHTYVESLGNAISIEIFLSFQIAAAGEGGNIYYFLACVNTT
jgi:hypothetical protein